MADRTAHAGWPQRDAILIAAGYLWRMGQQVQSLPGAQASGQVFALSLTDTRHGRDGTARAIIGLQARRIELGEYQLSAGQMQRCGPVRGQQGAEIRMEEGAHGGILPGAANQGQLRGGLHFVARR